MSGDQTFDTEDVELSVRQVDNGYRLFSLISFKNGKWQSIDCFHSLHVLNMTNGKKTTLSTLNFQISAMATKCN